MRIERTYNTIDIVVARDALKSGAVSAVSVLLLWLIGGAKVTAAILVAVTLLVSPLVMLERRPRRRRSGLARPVTPAAH